MGAPGNLALLTPDVGPEELISYFRPPELWENKRLLL